MWTHKHPTHRKTQRHNDVDEIEGLYYRLPLQMGNKNFASRPSDHRPTAEIKPSIDGRRQDFVKRGIRLWRQLETAGTANVSKRRRFVNVKTFNHVRCARYLRHLLFLEPIATPRVLSLQQVRNIISKFASVEDPREGFVTSAYSQSSEAARINRGLAPTNKMKITKVIYFIIIIFLVGIIILIIVFF